MVGNVITKAITRKPSWSLMLAFALVAACGGSGTRGVEAGPLLTPTEDPHCGSSVRNSEVATHPLRTMNDLVWSSTAGVIAHVESVSAPRWNSATGECWAVDMEKDTVFPFQY